MEFLAPTTARNGPLVNNSLEFVSTIYNPRVIDDKMIVFFDVLSLFTNVPIHLAVEVAEERLTRDESLEQRTSLLADVISRLLRFCLNQSHFVFNADTYHQIEGCQMGSPLTVTTANLVMKLVEEKGLSSA